MLAPVLGLCSAAAGYGQPRSVPGGFAAWKLLDSLTAQGGGATAIEEKAKSQSISDVALPLATDIGIPFVKEALKVIAKHGIGKEALNVIAKRGIPLGKKVLSYLAQCALCDTGCPSIREIQDDANQGEKAAKLMAVMDALEDINAVEKKLNELKHSTMKDNQMAEVEAYDWISSAIDGVGTVAKGVKGFAKKVVCDKV